MKEKEAEWRGRDDCFVLQYYTAPRDGGHREIITVQALDARTDRAWNELYSRFRDKAHFARWYFKTLEDAMDFDHWLWQTRYLDKKVSDTEILHGVRFD